MISKRNKEKYERKMEYCKIASQLALKYGALQGAPVIHSIHDKEVAEFWEGKYLPAFRTIVLNTKVSNIKWYIRNFMEPTEPLWNGDFLLGISNVGVLNWNKSGFPTLKWRERKIVYDAFKSSPYGGKIERSRKVKRDGYKCSWIQVPAFYLKSDNTTMSYLAGLLCAGEKYDKNGKIYAIYGKKATKEIEKLNIPIEGRTVYGCYISPFWPALLTPYMPKIFADYWGYFARAAEAKKYAAILWLTYFGDNFVSNKIPYLLSRRSIWYNFACEEGGVHDSMRKMRVSCGLTAIDKRFIDVIFEWNTNNWSEK